MLSCYVTYLILMHGLDFLFKNLLQWFGTYVPFGNTIQALAVAVRSRAMCLQSGQAGSVWPPTLTLGSVVLIWKIGITVDVFLIYKNIFFWSSI